MIKELQRDVRKATNPERAEVMLRFFKTGKGEYGEGDIFLGLSVPQSRALAKKYLPLSFNELQTLIKSKIHEERLIAVIILANRFAKATEEEQTKIYKFYLKNSKYVNNWDLVDSSAEYIVGAFTFTRDRKILNKLVLSKSIWDRRIAIMATFHYIKKGESRETLRLAKVLLNDKHDLIHKATGWMLREVGSRVSEKDLLRFLDKNATSMPRTMLRYSLEKLSPKVRRHYMEL
ncbi:DNA alkylation repair protein [Bdellovibrio sp. 22V]|uniref:DNA alkylation repair protein n=1 Tax=Bdellovibrio sp. 22V TaxID=3044166 RepID=UPI002542B4EF|nr:DNA alkylation repair protein [Bdellovibrio sp. 22V]WII71884.1 DNA alkylation repair protein [Bdellovibrio sp. 22V]